MCFENYYRTIQKVYLDSAEVVVLCERWLLVGVNSQPEPTHWEQSEATCWFWEAKSTVSYDLQNHLLIYMNRSGVDEPVYKLFRHLLMASPVMAGLWLWLCLVWGGRG